MPYGETKVYYDGSHYIAIPHTEKPHKRRKTQQEKQISFEDMAGYKSIINKKQLKKKACPKKQRLHFHGIFYIPEGTLPGDMKEVNSFSFSEHKRQITHQIDYFNDHFGRNDFRPIENKDNVGEAVAYILKYIEKSGEKIVYSRGLPQYFTSDIMEEDIACPFGPEDKKLLLFDDFTCWDECCPVGTVSRETIRQMRKSN